MSREVVFSYKTKGNTQPGGKPRVYFTCHPDDFDRYFDKVCADIFATHDCAIYYTEDMTAGLTSENNLVDLERMNLFVIPVTFRLLTQPNRAMDFDFRFAQEKHIPVLPIMMESGIDAVYSLPKNFGALQYLKPFSSDLTEISYAEKLKKYLESVLISDELAQRVRKAFDAYIFLSYRKKDRRLANELMRLIHSDPALRDIAVWYDEFLIPGESFRENIDRILQSSELFALLVTPNLLEKPDGKPNYVMGYEYPAAVKLGIAVLPAEMEKTDWDALKTDYSGIPTPVDAGNDVVFRSRLLDSITKAAISENNNDPEHNYLIGLAYLDGIDVEVNAQRAAELIEKSAGASFVPAMKKLVQMYLVGDGVKWSIEKAKHWQEKLVDLLIDMAEESCSEDDVIAAVREYMILGDLAYSVEDYDTAKEAFLSSYDAAKQLAFGAIGKNTFDKIKVVFKKYILNRSHSREAFLYLAKSCRMMLEMAYSLGMLTDIEKWTAKAILLTEAANRNNENAETAVELFSLVCRMSRECTMSGNLTGAQQWLEKGLSCWNRLPDEEKTREVKFAYLYLLDSCSEYSCSVSDYPQAFEMQETRKRILHEMCKEFSADYLVRKETIKCALSEVRICICGKDLNSAEQLLKCAEQLFDYEDEEDFGIQLLFSTYLLLRGRIDFERAAYDTALDSFKQSVGILQPIGEEKLGVEHQRLLAEVMEWIGDAYCKLNQHGMAAEWYQKAEIVLSDVVAFSKQIRDITMLASLYEKILDQSLALKNAIAIDSYNEKALWTRMVLVDGVELKGVLFSSRLVSELVEQGRIKSAVFQANSEAYQRLLGRQNEIRQIIKDCSVTENRLIDSVTQGKGDFPALCRKMGELTKAFLETHVVQAIREDLHVMADLMFKLNDPYDLCRNLQTSFEDAAKRIDRICTYIMEHYKPFFQFDEKGMLIWAFYSQLYRTVCKKTAADQTPDEFENVFDSLAFWNYSMSELEYGELWKQIYQWVKNVSII